MFKKLILLIVILPLSAYPQWKFVNAPSYGVSVVKTPGTIFTCTANGVIRKSLDSGKTWEILQTNTN
jgi:hypothetical protein